MNGSILITGCSSGFGYVTAQAAAAAGKTVVAAMRDPGGRNREAAAALETAAADLAGTLTIVEMDVTDDESVDRAVHEAVDRRGAIAVAVNNAGIFAKGYLEAFTVADVRHHFDVNLFGAIRVNRAVLPAMRARGDGLLVHVSSVAGRTVFPFSVPYGAAKFALEAVAEGYRYELARFGVDSILVEPAAYPTRTFASAQTPTDQARVDDYERLHPTFEAVFAGLDASVTGPGAGDPGDVAREILRLIDLPTGERPLRTVVAGGDEPWSDLNATRAATQRDLLSGMGLQDLLGGPGH